MDRAFGLLEFRSVDDEQRIIEGVASSDTLDDHGTILEPNGARFQVPFPLLWQHDSHSPVGEVIEARVEGNRIIVRAQIRKITEPGAFKDLTDMAWQGVKHKLVRGFSVGFVPLKTVKNRFIEWTLRELSLVTLPSNQDATIQLVRSSFGAASGASSPGVSGTQTSISNTIPKRTMTIAEQIQSFEARRTAIQERQDALMSAAAAEGRTLSDEENAEYEALDTEAGTVERDVARLQTRAAATRAAATPVNGTSIAAASASRGAEPVQKRGGIVTAVDRAYSEPGIGMARLTRAVALAHRKHRDLDSVVRELYPEDALMQRAAVAAHNTTTDSALVSDEGGIYADFVEYLRPQTIIGKFGTNGIPALEPVTFRTPLITQTGAGEGYWTGEGAGKGVTKFDWTRTTIEPLKVANIAVITDELLKSSSPKADVMIRNALVAALRARLDIDFINPAKAAVAGISPASITNAATPIPSSQATASTYVDLEDVSADVQLAMAGFIAANNAPTTGVWIMSATRALALSMMRNAMGVRENDDLSMKGGTFAGMPVIVSEYVDANLVVLVNAADVYLADDGGFQIDTSNETSLQMDSAPTNNSVTPTATTLVSMFQTNSVAIRAERTINWALRRASAVQVLEDVYWGGETPAA